MRLSHPDWLETPVSTPATRRGVLIGMSAALFAAACAERHPEAVRRSETPSPDPRFLRLSKALTGHHDLDPRTADRLSAAFRGIAPDLHAKFAPLANLHEKDPMALLAVADDNGLKTAALAIVAAWYTGSLGKEPRTATVAYRDALMQRTVADAMYPPTYASGGPGWWTAPPPAADGVRPDGGATRPLPSNDTEPRR